MKHFFLIVLLALSLAIQGQTRPQGGAAATYPVHHQGNETMGAYSNRLFSHRNQQVNPAPTPLSDAEQVTCTIKIDLDLDKPDNLIAVYAYSLDTNEEIEVYEFGAEIGADEIIMTLPIGEYDICVIGSSYYYKEIIMLNYEGIEINQDTALYKSFNDANITVQDSPAGSDGTLITADNIWTGNSFIIVSCHNTYAGCPLGSGAGFRNFNPFLFKTNKISRSFTLTKAATYLWAGGNTTILMPVDFTTEILTPSSTNWKTKEISFCRTPLNLKKEDVFSEDDWDSNSYAILLDLLYDGQYFLSGGGNGTVPARFGHHNENLIELWQPEEYQGKYEIEIFPNGSTVAQFLGPAPSIIGLPLKWEENGVYQTAVSPSTVETWYYRFTPDRIDTNGNPRLNGVPQYTILGNCSPALVTVPNGSAFGFTYNGRYGEYLQLDATSYYSPTIDWTDEIRQELGLPVSEVSISVNDEQICNSIDNYTNVFGKSGVFDCRIATDNVLVDGEISGRSETEFHYDSNVGNASSPTLTLLQFRDGNDQITDHFHGVKDANVEIYAMAPIETIDFTQTNAIWYETGEIPTVKIEWAPNGTDDWTELDVTENQQYFYMPGWGHNFSASLKDIDKESPNKWYDLRVYLEDEYGAWQRQVIRPAFKVEDQTSVETIRPDENIRVSGNDIIVPAEARIYNIHGQQVAPTNLPSGLYIVVLPTGTRKILL